MSASKSALIAVLTATLCSSAAYAASFAMQHRVQKSACPTAVENVGRQAPTEGQLNFANQENKADKATDKKSNAEAAPPAIGRHGLLFPAVKQGKAPGQIEDVAGKAVPAGAK